ncbi:MAG: MFS transporter [Candidatus Marinimicrobia bacterium]|nr:MFS transporter [Candidatus Neomarinimicrobiota bacterium]
MEKRSSFPPVFWVANGIEVLERFAYYGIYMGFGIYMEYLGYTKGQLGIVQSLFLLFSYTVPIISGTFADRFGFKKVLIISYLAYLPSILLLILTKSFSGIALTMLSIALAAGIFKPLVSGTVRVVTDKTNKTLGFGIFYAMVNVGASFGPVIAGQLRAISWNYAFLAAAISVGFMLLITIFFYKEPKREIEGITLKQKFKDMAIVFSDVKFSLFLIILGVFFWLPFWAFFNLVPVYIDRNIDTAQLYLNLKSLFGAGFTSIFSHTDEKGVWRILGETVAHTGYIIMICQIFVSRWAEKFKAMPTFLFGLFMSAIGFIVLGVAKIGAPALIFLGIFLFAIGEMISSPRIQEYITWIAPKEKAGLYMGTNFLATGLGGALSGVTYTSLYGYFQNIAHPEYIWYSLAAHFVIGIIVIFIFTKMLGEFKELDE